MSNVLENRKLPNVNDLLITHTFTSLRQSLTSLEDAKASLLAQQNTSGKGKNKVLDMLMAATKKGGPLQNVGLRGRLGDLGTIDPEFDVAIRYVHCIYHSLVHILYCMIVSFSCYYCMHVLCLSLIEVQLNTVILTFSSEPHMNIVFFT